MADRPCGVQALGADIHTILDTVAAEYAEGVVQLCQALFCSRVATVREEAIGLKQAGRTDKSIGIPPERRTAGRTAGAENTFV